MHTRRKVGWLRFNGIEQVRAVWVWARTLYCPLLMLPAPLEINCLKTLNPQRQIGPKSNVPAIERRFSTTQLACLRSNVQLAIMQTHCLFAIAELEQLIKYFACLTEI